MGRKAPDPKDRTFLLNKSAELNIKKYTAWESDESKALSSLSPQWG